MEPGPRPIDNTERQRIARAAWAYSGLGQRELAARTGIPFGTLRGYIGKGDKPGPDWTDGIKIADATGFPRYFMAYGFDNLSVLSAGLLDLADDPAEMPPGVTS